MGYGPYFCATRAGSKDCLWFGSFESVDKKFQVLLSGCVVPLQPSQPGVRRFPHVLAVPLLASPSSGYGGRGAAPLPLADPHIHHSPPSVFPSFAFCSMKQKTGKELFAVSRSSGFQSWHWALQKSFAVSMTNLAAFWLLGCHAWTSGRELRRWDQKEHFVIWEQRLSHFTQSSHAVPADAEMWLL